MFHLKASHELECVFPQKTGTELLEGVNELFMDVEDRHERLRATFRMLSYEKIAISGILVEPVCNVRFSLQYDYRFLLYFFRKT